MALCYYNEKFSPVAECALPLTDMAIQRGVGLSLIHIYPASPGGGTASRRYAPR